MTTSGGNGGADNWGWGVGPDSTPAADGASTTEFPPQSAQTPYTPQASHTGPGSSPGAAHSGYAAQPGSPAAAQRPTKPRPKWVPILALLVIVPLGIAAAFFGVNALRDSGGDSTGLIVDGAGSGGGGGGQGGSDGGPSPSGTVKDDSERTHFYSGDVDNTDIDPIKSEPFFAGDSNPENVRTMRDEVYEAFYVSQEDMHGSVADSNYEVRFGPSNEGYWIRYPSLGCEGTLRYAGTQGGTQVYEEVITSGTQNCADTGTWWFRVLDDARNQVAGFYESSDGRWRVSGVFAVGDAP